MTKADQDTFVHFTQPLYRQIRRHRYDKIISILSEDFFYGKTVLELGCALGHLGRMFEELGAIVTFAEGRPSNNRLIVKTNPLSKIVIINQELPWDPGEKFDLIIHCGVLYHLDNWEEDLKRVTTYSDLIFLDSEVADSDDPYLVLKPYEDKNIPGETISESSKGSRPSAACIERVLTELGMEYKRFDDEDLNDFHNKHDWKVTNSGEWKQGQRRFWMVWRKGTR